jgi:hypothetical protein
MLSLLPLLAILSVHVHPFGFVSVRHSTIEVTVTTEKDSHKHTLNVEVMGEDYNSLSERELEGDTATRQVFTFRNLPEGSYQVWATIVEWRDGKWRMQRVKGENLEVK